MRPPRWETVDHERGLVVAKVKWLRVYVRGDGTWYITSANSSFRLQSDHRTRGTNMELGKAAALEYINSRMLI